MRGRRRERGAELASLGACLGQSKATLDKVNAEGAVSLPRPAVLVVDQDRIVRFVDVQPAYTARTEVADITAALTDPDLRRRVEPATSPWQGGVLVVRVRFTPLACRPASFHFVHLIRPCSRSLYYPKSPKLR